MGIDINGYGCGYRICISKEKLEADGELMELVCDYFLFEPCQLFGEFLDEGVVEIDSDWSWGFWEDGSLPFGYPIHLALIMEACDDGSFVQFMNESDGVWEMFGKRRGKVVREGAWIECPLVV